MSNKALSTAFSIALLAAGQALADENTAAVPTSQSQGALEEVVVTAQRRGENLQNVPIAVTVLSAKTLEDLGARTTEDLTMASPGVIFNTGVGGGGISIRGIGGTNSGGDEPGNAVYVDGVYTASPSALLFQFFDVDRIEILKGPQGTLFGRNATGGVVNVTTRDPSFTAPRLDASVSYENYNTLTENVYASAPITSSIAGSLAIYDTHQGSGWGTNLPTGDDVHYGQSWGGRGKLKWQGESDTDFTLAALYTYDRPPATQGEPIIPGLLNTLGQPNPGFYNVSSDIQPDESSTDMSFSGTFHQGLNFARLVSITAYDRSRLNSLIDLDGTPLPLVTGNLVQNVKTFTQEFQLQSLSDSKINWLGGLFYMNSDRPADQAIISGLAFTPIGGSTTTTSHQITNSYSAFGQATVPVTNSTNITGGIRYTEDYRSIESYSSIAIAPTPVPIPLLVDQIDNGTPTWRLAIEQKLSSNVLVYLSDSRGFKSGLFNGTDPTAPPVNPQTLDAYELGIKAETEDHRYRLNASVFYYDFKNVQFKALNAADTGTIFLNAGRAHEPGLDIDAAASPIENLTITAAISLLDGHFVNDSSDKNVPCFTVPVAPVGGLISTPGGCSIIGNQLPNAPHTAATISGNYDFHTGIGKLSFTGALNYNSGYYSDPSNFQPGLQKSYELLNASTSWTSLSGTYEARLYGRNLLNREIIGGVDLATSGGNYFPQAPRTYGISMGVHF